ncbi:aspartic peptidase domain-containing protein [Phascolomyces articulosus]|uniref:Aspartic peptidase domain-containing protein n=1 Tax=Phascolomyces articulosus TaxID=60185 RepID=A0AAD5PA11_9FUNG|nr:aspartic peptidase domain-containing protein [Phascolomyces articulosus]
MRFSLALIASLALGANVFAVPLEERCNDGSCHKPKPEPLPEGVRARVMMSVSPEGQYMLPLSVGTPYQTGFNVVFDTGSEESWLPTSAACPDCSSGTYDPSASSSAVKQDDKPHRIEYDNGQCATVETYQDTVTWGSTWEVSYNNFTIGAATKLEGFENNNVGYFGFGNPEALKLITGADKDHYEGGSKKLRKRNKEDDHGAGPGDPKPADDNQWTKRQESRGVPLTLGIDNTAYTGEIYYFNLPASRSDCENQSIFWRTALKGVGLKDTYDCDVPLGSYVKFATGTYAIKAPPVQADILHLKFGAIYNIFEHRYEFKCSKAVPDLQLQFENYQINIPRLLWTDPINPDDRSEDAKCYSHIRRGSDRFKEWTIGTSVLNEFYQVYSYDMLRVGLAHPAQEGYVATITNIE